MKPERLDLFRVQLEATGWRVVDGCLDFGPYGCRREAQEVARQLNQQGWTQGASASALEFASVDDLLDGRSIN